MKNKKRQIIIAPSSNNLTNDNTTSLSRCPATCLRNLKRSLRRILLPLFMTIIILKILQIFKIIEEDLIIIFSKLIFGDQKFLNRAHETLINSVKPHDGALNGRLDVDIIRKLKERQTEHVDRWERYLNDLGGDQLGGRNY